MKRSFALVLALASSVMLPAPAAAQADSPKVVFEGIASAPSDNRVLYREQHRISGQCLDGQWRPEQHWVDYLRPGSNEPFAEKQLGFPGSLFRPEVDFLQPAYEERVEVSSMDDRVNISWRKGSREDRQWTLDTSENLVIDAGFDHFIRHHWSTLTRGEAVEFRFLAPTRGEAYGFVAEPAPRSIAGADHSFRIRPTGLLMQMLVDPIRLGYRNDGFLTHYVGLGNIRRSQDENYDVAIVYELQSEPPCPILPSP